MVDSDDLKIGRAFPRYELDASVDYVGAEVMLSHRIADISLGGIRLQTRAVEEVGTRVDLVIHFPDLHQTIATQGEVAWVKNEPPCEMGIRFAELGAFQRDILRRYLEMHPAKEESSG